MARNIEGERWARGEELRQLQEKLEREREQLEAAVQNLEGRLALAEGESAHLRRAVSEKERQGQKEREVAGLAAATRDASFSEQVPVCPPVALCYIPFLPRPSPHLKLPAFLRAPPMPLCASSDALTLDNVYPSRYPPSDLCLLPLFSPRYQSRGDLFPFFRGQVSKVEEAAAALEAAVARAVTGARGSRADADAAAGMC